MNFGGFFFFFYSLFPHTGCPFLHDFHLFLSSPVPTASPLFPDLTGPLLPLLPAAFPEAGGLQEVGRGGWRPTLTGPLDSDLEASPTTQEPPPVCKGVAPDIFLWGWGGVWSGQCPGTLLSWPGPCTLALSRPSVWGESTPQLKHKHLSRTSPTPLSWP